MLKLSNDLRVTGIMADKTSNWNLWVSCEKPCEAIPTDKWTDDVNGETERERSHVAFQSEAAKVNPWSCLYYRSRTANVLFSLPV